MPRSYPCVRHDAESDALYVYLHPGASARTTQLDDRRMVDIADDGTVIGIESLDVSGGVDLRDVPFPDTVAALLEPLPLDILAAHTTEYLAV